MWATTYLLVSVISLVNLYYLCLAAPVIMCYFPSTARDRTNIAKFEIKDINFTLCTHYIYHYAIIDNTTHKLVARDPSAEEGSSGLYSPEECVARTYFADLAFACKSCLVQGCNVDVVPAQLSPNQCCSSLCARRSVSIKEFTSAKIKFPTIKTLLFVGRIEEYPECLLVGRDTIFLNEFVTSAVALLWQYGFDGLDVCCFSTFDKRSIMNILKALREKFNEVAGDEKLILTVSAPGVERYIRSGYDVDVLAKTVDYVIIDTHELYVDTMSYAYFATPLYPIESSSPYNELGMNVSLNVWNSLGMPFGKMVVGFTGVGRMLELTNRSNYEPGAPVTLNKYPGPLYKINNGLAYPEICELRPTANIYFDDLQKSPYMVKNYLWLGYDDPDSLQTKIIWLKQFDVAGVMFSSLDEDDFTGTKCGEGQYPLLAAMKNATKEAWISVKLVSPEVDNNSTTTISHTDIGQHGKEDTNIVQYLLYGLLLMSLILLVLVVLSFVCHRNKPEQTE